MSRTCESGQRDRRRLGLIPPLVALVVLLAACTPGSDSGLDMGDLATVAGRVNGGGVECPLRFDREVLRPPSVSAKDMVVSLRIDGHGAMGTIGADDPTSRLGERRGIEVDCWYRVGMLRVDVSVVGVRNGTAIGQLSARLAQHAMATPAEMVAFLASNAHLSPGEARAVPGSGSVAYAPVQSSGADVGVMLSMAGIDGKVVPPSGHQLESMAAVLARAIAD